MINDAFLDVLSSDRIRGRQLCLLDTLNIEQRWMSVDEICDRSGLTLDEAAGAALLEWIAGNLEWRFNSEAYRGEYQTTFKPEEITGIRHARQARMLAKKQRGRKTKMYADLPTNAIQDEELSWDDPRVIEHVEHLLNDCEWFEDEEGYLYIVDGTKSEMHGPDNNKASQIWEAYECLGNDSAWDIAKAAGVFYIPVILRRFDPGGLGLYHA